MLKKIYSLSILKKKIKELRKKRKTIAFTNGCFDILHQGHVAYLQKAKYKSKNRILVVGLNSDRSVRAIKGKKRPIIDQKGRAIVLSALECVDFVVLFDEDTPLQLISTLKPDIMIKGADWKGKDVVGADIVKANGGKVELIKFVENSSTTNIVEEVLKKYR